MSHELEYTIRHKIGTTFCDVWTLLDGDGNAVNLTGATAKFEANSEPDGSGTELMKADETDYIALGGAAGTITFSIPANEQPSSEVSGYYDFDVTIGSCREAILTGPIHFVPRTTDD